MLTAKAFAPQTPAEQGVIKSLLADGYLAPQLRCQVKYPHATMSGLQSWLHFSFSFLN